MSIDVIMEAGMRAFKEKAMAILADVEETPLTPGSAHEVTQGLQQAIAADTRTHVPLDAAWAMAGESMTLEVREAVAFACAHVTADEAHASSEKSALFHPHPTQIKRAVAALGRQFVEPKRS